MASMIRIHEDNKVTVGSKGYYDCEIGTIIYSNFYPKRYSLSDTVEYTSHFGTEVYENGWGLEIWKWKCHNIDFLQEHKHSIHELELEQDKVYGWKCSKKDFTHFMDVYNRNFCRSSKSRISVIFNGTLSYSTTCFDKGYQV